MKTTLAWPRANGGLIALLSLLVWTLAVFVTFPGSLARADGAPKLPDQYAEAVLEVEGMI